MLPFRLTIDGSYQRMLEQMLRTARQRANLRQVRRVEAILGLSRCHDVAAVAGVRGLSPQTITEWVRRFLIYGPKGLVVKSSAGRPSKLTKAQRHDLGRLIDDGPQAAGSSGGCWRSPMIQDLILTRFGVAYNVHYISQLLHNLGFSFQKARFVSDHLDEQARRQWKAKTWPKILRLAKETGARILFGDEASFPQWGTLSYTWARRGCQPEVKTAGKRRGYKVLGLIEYGVGRFFYECTRERLNSATYEAFLTRVLEQISGPIILIQDGAKYHSSAAIKPFFAAHAHRLKVVQLPTYSPDVNPIEKLWKQIKQTDTHLVYFPTFEALTATIEQALVKFANAREQILSLFGLPAKAA
jgi:transposase